MLYKNMDQLGLSLLVLLVLKHKSWTGCGCCWELLKLLGLFYVFGQLCDFLCNVCWNMNEWMMDPCVCGFKLIVTLIGPCVCAFGLIETFLACNILLCFIIC